MFKKVLIANRGEIAVRLIRACRELNISPVAIYSEADRDSLHVRMVDEAICVGPPSSSQSYLNIPAIIDAARQTGVEAVHPGYGFLAENAEFARVVNRAGITLIGPSAEAMETMGSKTSARRAAVEAKVLIVPGTVEPLKSLIEAQIIAREFGYPVMLKASAGGGGKGMRLVVSEEEISSAYETACAEALAAFGDSSLYLEKAIESPRHIEIQIFADSHGNCVHLGERECSIQRRHQKVIEECPSPIDDAELRNAMGAAAIRIAQAVNYVGAGTVEFLLADSTREFYFLEMNTRLQVEHPVTELVTGIDLVREQFAVADGAKLSFKQEDVYWKGRAVECRIYAEDPGNNFFPSPGTIGYLHEPSGPGIRVDSGVSTNSEVSIHYDPMIAKLAVWGRSRQEAINRMARALDEYRVEGITTNLQFFREIVADSEFVDGKLDTGFIDRFNERQSERQAEEAPVVEIDMALIAAAVHYAQRISTYDNHRPVDSAWKTAGRRAALDALRTLTHLRKQ